MQGSPPRLQVVRYRLVSGRVMRFASPPLANVGEVRRALAARDDADGWSAVPLMGGVGSFAARVYIPEKGWTTQMRDVASKITENDNSVKVPQVGSAPLPRAVRGVQVALGGPNLQVPITRIFMVGE
jgi:general secretion pathway protein J